KPRFPPATPQQAFTSTRLPVLLPKLGPPGFTVLGLRRVLDEWLACTSGVRPKLRLLAFYDTTADIQTLGPPTGKLLCVFSNAEICEAEPVNMAGEKVR